MNWYKTKRWLWAGLMGGCILYATAQESSLQPLSLDLSFVDWGLSGNVHKFRQYATPPEGVFLRELRYVPFSMSRMDRAWFILRSPGEEDYAAEGRADLSFGMTQAEAWFTRHRFFDPSPVNMPTSQRQVQEGSLRHFLTPEFALALRYRMDQQDYFLEPPLLPLRQLTRRWEIAAEGRLWGSQLNLSYTDLRYFDRTDVRRDTTLTGWSARSLWQLRSDIGVEGSFARTNIEQAGVPRGSVEALAFTGDWAIAPTTDLNLLLRRERFDLPMVRNGFVRERNTAHIGLVHRWRGWTVRLGFRQQDLERVRGDQTFVDTPRYRTVEGRLSGSLGSSARLTLRAYQQSLTREPVMITQDARPLFWKRRDYAQIKLDGGTPTLNGYLTWTYQRMANGFREVGLTTRILTVGGNWEAAPRFSLFVELSNEWWHLRSEVSQEPTLDRFAPDSRTLFIGLNWQIDRNTVLSGGYIDLASRNDNPLLLPNGNIRGRYLTLTLRHRLPSGSELAVKVAPWRYQDRVVGFNDYHATVIMLMGSFRL